MQIQPTFCGSSLHYCGVQPVLDGVVRYLPSPLDVPPVLAVVGGHSFQDYEAYRSGVLERAEAMGLEIGDDVVIVGTVDDPAMPAWFWSG